MAPKEWDRADYIEEDVRRHSGEIRALTQLAQENSTALKALLKEQERFVKTIDKEFERRAQAMSDHESRLRAIEGWKSRTGAYWTLIAFGMSSVVGLLTTQILPRLGLA